MPDNLWDVPPIVIPEDEPDYDIWLNKVKATSSSTKSGKIIFFAPPLAFADPSSEVSYWDAFSLLKHAAMRYT